MSSALETGRPPERKPPTAAQYYFVALILGLTLAGVLYRLLVLHDLEHSALMFLGIPCVLAIVLALTPKAKSVTGGIMKGMTLALLLLAPLLGEGMLCIVIASPLFYVLGLIVGLILDHQRAKKARTMCCLAAVLLPMCLEGTTPRLTVARPQTVSVTRVVAASAGEVAEELAHSPRLGVKLPEALRVGFPLPLGATGEGVRVGDLRVLHFSGAEGAPAGDVAACITESAPGHLRSQVTEDTTKLAQWLTWKDQTVDWRALDANHTEVTWTIGFERQLDPAWYFVPMERAAMHEVAAYMIEANAMPASSTAQPR